MSKCNRNKLTANAKPCEACPYRRDCPPGLWDASEYFKLVRYDVDPDSVDTPPPGVFMCHDARDGETVCKGWLDVHGADQLCIRLAENSGVDVSALDEFAGTTVPLFASGREAALHGLTGSHIQKRPGNKARSKQAKLERRHPDIKRQSLPVAYRKILANMHENPRLCWIEPDVARYLLNRGLVTISDRQPDGWRCWITPAGVAEVSGAK